MKAEKLKAQQGARNVLYIPAGSHRETAAARWEKENLTSASVTTCHFLTVGDDMLFGNFIQ